MSLQSRDVACNVGPQESSWSFGRFAEETVDQEPIYEQRARVDQVLHFFDLEFETLGPLKLTLKTFKTS